MSRDEAVKLLEETVARIGEHFEAAQILVTWSEEGDCHFVGRGNGNAYARVAMARELIKQWDAQTSATEIARALDVD